MTQDRIRSRQGIWGIAGGAGLVVLGAAVALDLVDLGCGLFDLFPMVAGVATIATNVRGRKAMQVFRQAHAATDAEILDRGCRIVGAGTQGESWEWRVIIQFDAGGRRVILETLVSK